MTANIPKIHDARVDMYLELEKFRADLQSKLNCSEIESIIATRSILASLLHNLGSEALEEMGEFITAVRAKLG